uniref:Uncharacterized protein n=1 Tax=Ditylenchus dipsaci TaxID=166011 RepID=A0A915EU42_9BILA
MACNKVADINGNFPNENKPNDVRPEKIKLERNISLLNACAIVIGCIVGSGIFVSPKGILQHTGSAFLSLCLWLACGLYTMLGSLCYAELGTSIPKSGGDYAYIAQAFGPLPAYIFLWISLVILNPTASAVVALTFANYVLKPVFPDCDVPDLAVRLLAACLILTVMFVNCYNVNWSTKLQNCSTLGKVTALIIVVLLGAYYAIFVSFENLQWDNFTANTNLEVTSIAMAFYSGEPHKNLPKAIYISIPAVTAIYILVNLAYFSVLQTDEVLESSAVAVTFAYKVMGPIAAIIMPLFVACSCIGGLNGTMFTYSRMFFAGASYDKSKALDTYTIGLLLGSLSLCMLTVSDVYKLINYLAFTQSLVVATAVAGLLKLRWTHPDMHRPIKMNILVPVTFLSVTIYILLMPFLKSPFELVIAALIIAAGVPFYFLFIYWENKPKYLYGCWIIITKTIQKLLFCVAEEE